MEKYQNQVDDRGRQNKNNNNTQTFMMTLAYCSHASPVRKLIATFAGGLPMVMRSPDFCDMKERYDARIVVNFEI